MRESADSPARNDLYTSGETVFKMPYLGLNAVDEKSIWNWIEAGNQFAILSENSVPNNSFSNGFE
jgi:hypothetical protein